MKTARLPMALAAAFWLCLPAPSRAQSPSCEPVRAAVKFPAYSGKVVKIGMSPTQPPYAFADPADPIRMSGLEVEMIEKAMACAGLRYEFVKGAWAGLLQSLFSGNMDVMIGNVNYRPDRAEKADFVLYLRAGQTTVVQKGNPKKITDTASLCGASGAATVGGTSARFIELLNKDCVDSGRKPIDFLPSADGESAYRQVANKRVDFVMDDAASAAARTRTERANDYESAFTNWTDIKSGMVVLKGNEQILRAVADGLKVQQIEGSLEALMRKYELPPELVIPIEARR